MEFRTIQHEKSRNIIMYFVNSKRVTRSKFLHLENLQWLKGRHYCNSLTTRTRNNNFRHTANL